MDLVKSNKGAGLTCVCARAVLQVVELKRGCLKAKPPQNLRRLVEAFLIQVRLALRRVRSARRSAARPALPLWLRRQTLNTDPCLSRPSSLSTMPGPVRLCPVNREQSSVLARHAGSPPLLASEATSQIAA